MYYLYRNNVYIGCRNTREQAIEFAENEKRGWLEQGLKCPPLKVEYNGSKSIPIWNSETGEIPFVA
jgi:hypothetical protein